MAKRLLLLFIFLILLPATALATTTLVYTWNANTDSDLGGYRIYEKQINELYVLVQDVGNVLSHTEMVEDGNHIYVLTAYDHFGNESDYSDEVIVFTDSIPPGVPGQFKVVIYITLIP